MRLVLTTLACALTLSAFTVTVSCGGDGKTGGQPPRPHTGNAPEPAPPDQRPDTYVLTETLPYTLPELVECLREGGGYGRLPTAKKIRIDGVLADWAEQIPAASLTDPLGDAPPEADIGTYAVGNLKSDLLIGVMLQRGKGVRLVVELGGVLQRRGKLALELRRSFRLDDDGLAEHDGKAAHTDGSSNWKPVDASQLQLAAGAGGIELRLAERLLGDALTWPAFWVKLHTEDASGHVLDAVSSITDASVLASEDAAFTFSGCQEWAGQAEPLQLRFVFDKHMAVPSRRRVTPSVSVASWVGGLVRAAVDVTSRELGGLTLPTQTTTVYVVDAKLPDQVPAAAGGTRPDAAYDGLLIAAGALASGATDYYPEADVFARTVAHVARLEILGRYATAPTALVDAVATALVDHVVRRTLGDSYWLDSYRSDIEGFLAESDAAAPRSILRQPWPRKAAAFGHLLGSLTTPVDLLAAWSAAAARAQNGEAPDSALLEALLERMSAGGADVADRESFQRLWSGWLVAGSYADGFGPEQLDDQDLDGLPTFLEARIGTRHDRPDTDDDGWNDYAELVTGSDPLAATKNPSVLVPDGSFGDWLELMPKRVTIDRGHSGSCPHTADVSHYAAVAGHDVLLIGGFAADFLEDEPAAQWQAVVDLPTQTRQLVVTVAGGSRTMVVKDGASGNELLTRHRAVPMGRGTVEMALDRIDLGLEPWTSERGAMKIRLRTVFADQDGERYCDETGWFSPEFNE